MTLTVASGCASVFGASHGLTISPVRRAWLGDGAQSFDA